jgi:hypothetical protein
LSMLLGQGLGVIRMLLPRYLMSPSDFPGGSFTSDVSFSAIAGWIMYPV